MAACMASHSKPACCRLNNVANLGAQPAGPAATAVIAADAATKLLLSPQPPLATDVLCLWVFIAVCRNTLRPLALARQQRRYGHSSVT